MTEEPEKPAWEPLGTTERRVLGVLVEKAKTTPDAYPLTVNGITTGANQKSNRSPLMQLDPFDVETALENLRRLGAVVEIQGGGRMAKYRHRMYEWMGVEKAEAAVMTELLLRGEQTLGELRGRAARMNAIAGVAELKPIVASLMAKGLVQALTPEGRGQIVTHCLYLPEQQEKLKRIHGEGEFSFSAQESVTPAEATPTAKAESSAEALTSPAASASPETPGKNSEVVEELKLEIEELRSTVEDLEKRLASLEQLVN